MIERAIECKVIYCSVLLDDNLTECILNEVEWRRLDALRELLEHFDKFTTIICASKTYVTITMTVVIYNSLMGVIENFIRNNEERLPDICHGARAAYNKLSQYYAATDNSPISSVATAIHPAMRFQYWSDQRWWLNMKITPRRLSETCGRIGMWPTQARISPNRLWMPATTTWSSLFLN
ncbi:hypothetical protein EDD21DRAFT_139470 [Dissophora ornata]|nr:hypothetical protein EDD21DRAFT_139470 [Dissophora ornata]